MYSIYALVFAVFYPAHGSVCIPKISDNMPDKENFKQIECVVSKCGSVSQLRFEKLLFKQKHWTPVYERFNTSYHQSLDTELSQYSLRNRSDYIDLKIKHVLYIHPPKVEDQGQWRCVVSDITGVKYESKAMDINIYVTPPEKLRIVPNNVELYTNQTTEFVCMADGIHPVPDVLWIVDGTGQSTGNSYNKQHGDGLWSVMNTIKISFNKVGVSDLRCIMRTTERDQWMQKQIHILVKDNKGSNQVVTSLPDDINNTPSNINLNVINPPCNAALYVNVTVSCVVCAIVIAGFSIFLWKSRRVPLSERNKRVQMSSHTEMCYINRAQQFFRIPSEDKQQGMIEENTWLLSDTCDKTSPEDDCVTIREKSWCIWSSTDSKCVFIGGQSSPSITMIKDLANQTTRLLSTGTCIVYGLFIKSTFHLINVYDNRSQKHFICCVSIESATEQLTPRHILQLGDEIIEPRCLFTLDKSSIGIYCAKQRLVQEFNIDNISSYATPGGIIRLNGYDANENDSLCANKEGHICVLSYKYRNVYIFNKCEECIYKFNTGMWYDPVYIQCLDDNSLAVVNLYGEIRRYINGSKPKIINLGENTYVQAAVLTGSFVCVIDALDSTKIHVFKASVE